MTTRDEMMAKVNPNLSRPKHKPNRFVVDNEYVEKGYLACLPQICTKIYLALLVHCNTKTQTAFPGIERLKEYSGEKNKNSVFTAIRILEEYRIIIVFRTVGGSHKSNLYQFVSSKEWLPVDKSVGKILLTDYTQRYQSDESNSIKNKEENSGSVDTLTRSSDNYLKDITNQMDLLVDRMRVGTRVAIQQGPGDTVDRITNLDPVPVNTGKLREANPDNGINIDTVPETVEPLTNGEKTDEGLIEDPFKKGEKGSA